MAETTYNYSREISGAGWNINNKNRPLTLAQEIDAAVIPGLMRIDCNGANVDIKFSAALDGTQKTLLDTVVATHKTDPI